METKEVTLKLGKVNRYFAIAEYDSKKRNFIVYELVYNTGFKSHTKKQVLIADTYEDCLAYLKSEDHDELVITSLHTKLSKFDLI